MNWLEPVAGAKGHGAKRRPEGAMQETWRELLESAIDQEGLKGVAARLGYAASSLSLARHDRYNGSTDRIAARVIEVYGHWECPHLARNLDAKECQTFAQRATPTSNPQALKHWAACQECPYNPEGKP